MTRRRWLRLLNVSCIQTACDCLSCLPHDSGLEHVVAPLPLSLSSSHLLSLLLPGQYLYQGPWTMVLPAWYSSIFPFPFGVLRNSQNEAFCDLTPAHLSDLSSLLNTNKAILSGGFFTYFLSTWKMPQLITMSTSTEKPSRALETDFLQLWQTQV